MSDFLEMCKPDIWVDRIWNIDIEALKQRGVDAVLLDLDNTLLPWKDSALPSHSKLWVERLKSSGIKVCIVSNTHYPDRMKKIAKELGIYSVARAMKPRRDGFDRARKLLSSDFDNMAVIGDQLLTDVLGGNLLGMQTILVDPLHPREFAGTKISRLVEKLIFYLLRRNGLMGTNAKGRQSEGIGRQ